jgi:4-amino-4-deoxy-L-arabinose transferase-like glycosyltransferase
MAEFSRKDELFTALPVVMFMMLLLVTATGSAIAMVGMIVMFAIALALMLAFTPRTQLRSALLIALMGAVIGIGVLLAFFKIVPVDRLR